MQKEIQELFDYLKSDEINFEENDLFISEADESEDTDYVSCGQKSIIFVDGVYHITDYYDSHPCFEFKTKEEVRSFYIGLNEANEIYYKDPNDTARFVGLVTLLKEFVNDSDTAKEYKQAISKKQRLINQE